MDALPVPLLTLDPSSTMIGWSLLSYGPLGPQYIHSGTWKVPEAPIDLRVMMAGDAVRQLIGQCNPRPSLILIEMPDYISDKANRSNIILYFRAVGCVEYAAYQSGIPVDRVKASAYKEKTSKETAKLRFRSITGRWPMTDDESDAVAIGWDYLVKCAAEPPHEEDCVDSDAL